MSLMSRAGCRVVGICGVELVYISYSGICAKLHMNESKVDISKNLSH
jgi:hypothetical protein